MNGSWSPLVGPDRTDSEELRRSGHELLRTSWWESLQAGLASDFTAPGSTASLLRSNEIDDALGRTPQVYGRGAIMPPSQRTGISAEDWKASKDYRPGLSYFDGMTTEAAKILAERHDTIERRNDVMNRNRSGLLGTGAQYAVRFAAMVADPINVASAFVPVVSELRAARLAAQLGKFGGRAAQGLIEGTVGQALIEPLAHATAAKSQEDYTMLDSLANVGMGGLFGGALHSVGGAVGDVIRARGPRAHVAAMDTALVQVVSGKSVDVVPVLRAAERTDDPAFGGVQSRGVGAEIDANAYGMTARQRERDLIAQDRETIRKGREADALKPRTFEQQRSDALADLEAEFPSREITLRSGGKVTRKGPMDLVTFLRAQGGIAPDAGGELRGMDAHLYNKSREIPFAKGEQFLGRLVHDGGLPLEVAAQRARDAGYLGDRQVSTNEWGESSVDWTGGPDELIVALDKNLRATGIADRTWGPDIQDRIAEYEQTLRVIDENEHFGQAREEEHLNLDDDPDADRGEDYDPDHAAVTEGADDAEMLWQDAEERLAASEGRDLAAEAAIKDAAGGNREYLKSPAFRVGDKVFAADGHAAALEKAQQVIDLDTISRVLDEHIEWAEGYVTNTGRWVSHADAMEIAFEAGQVSSKKVDNSEAIDFTLPKSQPKPTPEQELAQLTQRIDTGMKAAAACIGRGL